MSSTEETTIDKIDHLVEKCYNVMLANDYFNENGIGKFKAFCIAEEFDTDCIPEELKTIVNQEYEHAFESLYSGIMWKILGGFYNLIEDSKSIQQNLTWFNIANIIKSEFDENICKSFLKIQANQSKFNYNDIPNQG
eukprot:231631_1